MLRKNIYWIWIHVAINNNTRFSLTSSLQRNSAEEVAQSRNIKIEVSQDLIHQANQKWWIRQPQVTNSGCKTQGQ
jgi:hypothetical protein